MDEVASGRSWHEIVRDVLKRHDVRLVTYVPDNVLRPLIDAVHADPFFTAFSYRARGGGGGHRLRRVDGRAARHRADADLAGLPRCRTRSPRLRCRSKFRC